jgi:hypothetical protein
LQTSQMGSLDTMAQSQSAGLGAYGPALEAARGQSLAEMATTLAGQKGALGSDLLNLESQHEAAMSQGEMDLFQKLVEQNMTNADREYQRQVQGWESRSKLAIDAAKELKEAQKEAAKQQQLEEFMRSQTETAGLETEARNTPQWNAFLADLSPAERNALNELSALAPDEGSLTKVGSEAGANLPPWFAEQVMKQVPLSAGRGIFGKALSPLTAFRKVSSRPDYKAKALQAAVGRKLVDAGPALFGRLGQPGNKSSTGSTGKTQYTINF